MLLPVLLLLLFVKYSTGEVEIQMLDQIADEEDPCVKRYRVDVGETCASVARANGIRVQDLLLLNPNLDCNKFYSDIDICVDMGSMGKVLDAATGNKGFRLLSRAELNENEENSNVAAVQPAVVDYGSGK